MKFLKNVRDWNRARKIEAELNALSNHQLNDIGIGRHGISEVARNW